MRENVILKGATEYRYSQYYYIYFTIISGTKFSIRGNF